MGRVPSCYKTITLLAALWVASPALAEVPPLEPFNYTMKYDVTWNNLPIGRIRVDTSENEFRYQMTADTKTRGIIRMFDSTKSIIKTTGRYVDEKPVQQSYESRSTGDSPKITTIRYDDEGLISKRTRLPADDPLNRPPVPIEDANKAVDPLTGMYLLRERMHRNIARNVRDTTIRTYDGARLADFTFTVVSRASLKSRDKHINAINTVMKRTPIAGYKKKELKKYADGDPTIHVYFSADGDFIPLQADIELGFGTVSAKLVDFKKK